MWLNGPPAEFQNMNKKMVVHNGVEMTEDKPRHIAKAQAEKTYLIAGQQYLRFLTVPRRTIGALTSGLVTIAQS